MGPTKLSYDFLVSPTVLSEDADFYFTEQQAFSPFANCTSAYEIVCPIASVRFMAFTSVPLTEILS